MGNKVSPIGLRVGINKEWSSKWYVEPREYAKTLHEDLAIRKRIYQLPEVKGADVAEVEIVRHPQRITVIIHTARPGVLIGVKGANIERIGLEIQKVATKKVQIKIKEIKKTDTNAQIVAQNIARQLENRGSFRRALKMAISNAIKGGAQGCKIRVSGRLGGADMSRTEELKEGRIPLHTLRADIDYGFYESQTTFGKIGVKVWIYQGMVYNADKNEDAGMLARKARREPAGSAAEPRERRDSERRDSDRREGGERRPRRPAAPRGDAPHGDERARS
ncbi:MAG: 30S ribosomal protein S3 [Spirochaetia bacterium]|uniref:KH type-2 domain-containing protein n=1 Tax=bioreactor metagenome TaxID=1076179 RepID=A0A644TEG4_9ZZZZ|nr:30S ribosomal protein S3 [Spirochaetia bacterium]MDD3819836.1 30S ribosomal protein S3 [Spirochaetales bacterium]NLX46167.1 30S ribosomal protein S3 [Treponema sp.]VBB38645.1 30S ribosomal subunit protein S3 [uncultured Spirochaetota bacterium]HAP54968.1 30S ribosomal protein S3 [Spirochaetaceae bacterium]